MEAFTSAPAAIQAEHRRRGLVRRAGQGPPAGAVRSRSAVGLLPWPGHCHANSGRGAQGEKQQERPEFIGRFVLSLSPYRKSGADEERHRASRHVTRAQPTKDALNLALGSWLHTQAVG